MNGDIESRLREYVANLKARKDEVEDRITFCQQHNMREEARWLNREADILCTEYVLINNNVLGIYF